MNKSTSSLPSRNPHARYKAARCHHLNIQGFIEDFGLNHCGLLTLVSARHVTWKDANANVTLAQRALLEPLFVAWFCIVELHKDGRPHFHFLVASAHDLRTGFDFEARDRAKAINDRAQLEGRRLTPVESAARRKLHRLSFEKTDGLRAIWQALRPRLPHYEFGRAHPGSLEPVRSAEGISQYLVKLFGADALPRPSTMKGAHFVRYSKNQNRRANQRFAWNGARSRLHRRQLARVGVALGVAEDEFCSRFGRYWHRQFTDLVACLTYDHGDVDGHPGWSDEQIRRAAQTYLPLRDIPLPAL